MTTFSFVIADGRIQSVKVVVSGPGGVGKTTLLARYSTDKYIPGKTTVGVNFLVRDEGDLRISFWDYAGEERFKVLFPGYSTGSSGAVLAFDTTRPQTLKDLPDWLNIIREKNPDGIPIILIGCKFDAIEENEHDIVNEIADNFCKKFNLTGYYLSSSKTGEGIESPFSHLAILIKDYLRKRAMKG